MKEQLEALAAEARAAISAATSEAELEAARVAYLGKKSGRWRALMGGLGSLPAEERPAVGKLVQSISAELEALLEARQADLAAPALQGTLDVTLPGRTRRLGHRHPTLATLEEAIDVFLGLGFRVAEGPEVDNYYYSFEALNYPDDHPAMDEQMTFYITDDMLLRSQTSTMQIRTMEQEPPPVAYVVPGRCYRRDRVDRTHCHTFYQLEGFMVGEGITFADLKGVLEAFARGMFGERARVRLRPDFFPFTEPSGEVAFTCLICGGEGCRVCSGSGWLEVMGCGMIDPHVLRNVGYDPEQVSGFAFGGGVDRIAMLRHGLDDIRALWDNDMRVLQQL